MTSLNDLIQAGVDPDERLCIPNGQPLTGRFTRYWGEDGNPLVSLGFDDSRTLRTLSQPPAPKIRVHLPDVIAGLSLTHDEARELRAQINAGLGTEPRREPRAGDRVRIVGPSTFGNRPSDRRADLGKEATVDVGPDEDGNYEINDPKVRRLYFPASSLEVIS